MGSLVRYAGIALLVAGAVVGLAVCADGAADACVHACCQRGVRVGSIGRFFRRLTRVAAAWTASALTPAFAFSGMVWPTSGDSGLTPSFEGISPLRI